MSRQSPQTIPLALHVVLTGCLLTWVTACQPAPAGSLDTTLIPIDEQPTTVWKASVQPIVPDAAVGGFFPLMLPPVTVELTPDRFHELTVNVPDSAQAVLASLQSTIEDVEVFVGDKSIRLGKVNSVSTVLIPVSHGKFQLRPTKSGFFTVNLSGMFEYSGGGSAMTAEEPVSLVAGAGETGQFQTTSALPDDTTMTLVSIEMTRTDAPGMGTLSVVSCRPEMATPLLEIMTEPSKTTQVLTWLPTGEFCFQGTHLTVLKVQALARSRRFLTERTERIQIQRLLDARIETGRNHRVQLQGIPEGTTALWVEAQFRPETFQGELKLYDCESGYSVPLMSGTHSVVLPLASNNELCMTTSANGRVRLSLLGLVRPEKPHENVTCRPLPLMPESCVGTNVVEKLRCIPGLEVTQREPGVFSLRIPQPVDHFVPDGPTFKQRLTLRLVNESAPTILNTTGYQLFDYVPDLAEHLTGNVIEVEHRYFGPSTPQSMDRKWLTVLQSAYDSHRIVETLKPIFKGPWVNTGHSKGGETALFHRRYFPCDVTATVSYVTPLMYSLNDERLGNYLHEAGGERYAACHQSFREIERTTIRRRDELSIRLSGSYSKAGSPIEALYMTASLLEWIRFQYEVQDDPENGCSAFINAVRSPSVLNAIADDLAQYAEGYSDQNAAQLAQNENDLTYYFQACHELGLPGDARRHLLEFGPIPKLPSLCPLIFNEDELPVFDSRTLTDAQRWLSTQGERFIFVYGALDPWTGGAVSLGEARDAALYVAPSRGHGAGIADLAPADLSACTEKLRDWFNGPAQGQMIRIPSERPRFKDVMRTHGLQGVGLPGFVR